MWVVLVVLRQLEMDKSLKVPFCGLLKNKKYLIHDRDVLYIKKVGVFGRPSEQ
jgi:hypothetical protein